MLGNKLLLTWKEPRRYLKYVKKQITWKVWLGLHILRGAKWAFAFLILLVIAAWFNENINLFYRDALIVSAFGFGIGFIISFLGWLSKISPAQISIREKDIVRIGADNSFVIKYKDIKSCAIRGFEIENVKFEVLEIIFWNGKQATFEIAPDTSGETVLQNLQKFGVNVEFQKQLHTSQNTID